MKTVNFKIILLFLVFLGLCTGALAQEKAKTDQERKDELYKAIEEQKKVLNEQNKALDEKRKEQAKAEKALEQSMMKMREELNDEKGGNNGNNGNNENVYIRSPRPYGNIDRYYSPNPPNLPNPPNGSMQLFFGEDVQRTTWDFSKYVKESTFKKEYVIDVDKTSRSIIMSLSGDCKSGGINIKIFTPDGKAYSDGTIDGYVNMNVRKSINITETENQDKTGEWKFVIESNNATGYFNIHFQSF